MPRCKALLSLLAPVSHLPLFVTEFMLKSFVFRHFLVDILLQVDFYCLCSVTGGNEINSAAILFKDALMLSAFREIISRMAHVVNVCNTLNTNYSFFQSDIVEVDGKYFILMPCRVDNHIIFVTVPEELMMVDMLILHHVFVQVG